MTNPDVLRLAQPPRRRVEAMLRISADSWDDMKGALRCIENDLDRYGELSKSSVSGGYSFGWIIESDEDTSITHESWAKELNDHLRQPEKGSTDE